MPFFIWRQYQFIGFAETPAALACTNNTDSSKKRLTILVYVFLNIIFPFRSSFVCSFILAIFKENTLCKILRFSGFVTVLPSCIMFHDF